MIMIEQLTKEAGLRISGRANSIHILAWKNERGITGQWQEYKSAVIP